VLPEAPEVNVATVVPFELNVTVAPAAPVIVPETVYVFAVAANAEAVALAPLTVTEALAGLNV
jgi:hypothetical protein